MVFCYMNCTKEFIGFFFLILVLIRYASTGIKDEPESKNVMFTLPND